MATELTHLGMYAHEHRKENGTYFLENERQPNFTNSVKWQIGWRA